MVGKNRKILIVDDDINIRESLKIPLILRGYEILEASNGQDGLMIARKEKPLIILLDILLSKLDGFRVARFLKFDERYKDIYMIAITQLGRQETQDEAQRMGFNSFMTKPLDTEAVIEKIERMVAEHQN
ncbi:MAG: response regulator [Candidatus Omnitrophica bacterium]|nr:response regulator [Candidatus Omnitrophota bacterium]